MRYDDFILAVRRYLRDEDGTVWDDQDLSRMTSQALIDYSLDSGMFKAESNFLVDENSQGKYPQDFLFYVAGFNDRKDAVRPIDGKWVNIYQTPKGTAEGIYDDLSSNGFYKLYPNPFDPDKVKYYIPQKYGVVLSGEYYGLCPDDGEYGLCDDLIEFDSLGSYQYGRVCSFNEVQDYQALIFNILAKAYIMDTDFQNEKLAALYIERYRERTNGVQNITSVDFTQHIGEYY